MGIGSIILKPWALPKFTWNTIKVSAECHGNRLQGKTRKEKSTEKKEKDIKFRSVCLSYSFSKEWLYFTAKPFSKGLRRNTLTLFPNSWRPCTSSILNGFCLWKYQSSPDLYMNRSDFLLSYYKVIKKKKRASTLPAK